MSEGQGCAKNESLSKKSWPNQRRATAVDGQTTARKSALHVTTLNPTCGQVAQLDTTVIRRVVDTRLSSQRKASEKWHDKSPTGPGSSSVYREGMAIYRHIASRTSLRLPRSLRQLGVTQANIPRFDDILIRIYRLRLNHDGTYSPDLARYYNALKSVGLDDLYAAIMEVADYERMERQRRA